MNLSLNILLQSDIAGQAIEGAFNVSPTTVYGLLVGLLVTLTIALLGYIGWTAKKHREAMGSQAELHKTEMEKHYDHLRVLNSTTIEAVTSTREKLSTLTVMVQNLKS